jgi:polysaccharide export outer membrane protein
MNGNLIAYKEGLAIMMYRRTIDVMALSLLMIGLTGCFSSNPRDIEAFLKPYQVDVTAKRYVLQPPDEIEIHCSKIPEIHLQRQRIRPDGKVSFEALGEIVAAGKTPEEVANVLGQKAAQFYTLGGDSSVDLHMIDVRIAAYYSKVYYVLGQVDRPGPRDYTGRDTVLTALSLAQPNPMAWEERVQVVRPSRDESIRPKIFEVNFDRMIAHGDISKDVLLQEGDIVYVPPTVFAAIAMKIEEVIRPIARAFFGSYIVQQGPAVGAAAGAYSRY